MALGDVLARSGFFPDTRGAAQAVVKILAGRELGYGPITSMTDIYVVKGRVTIGATLIAATIRRSQRYDYRIKHLDDQSCQIVFLMDDNVIGVSSFTIDDAKKANLVGGDNWKKYPRNMLFARAVSNGAKWFCPDIFSGASVYTPDELGVDSNGETGEVIAVPTEVDLAPILTTTLEQYEELQRLIHRKGIDLFKVLAHYQVQSLLDLTTEQYEELTTILDARPDSQVDQRSEP